MPTNPAFISLSALNGQNGFRIDGIDAYDNSGASVSSAGDVNGDGFDDILIGAYGGDPGGVSGAGESYVVFGKASGFGASLDLSTLDGSNGFRIDGIDAFDYSGRSVSSAGDVNGDGFDDILIGTFGADPGGDADAGESYVVFGKASGFGAAFDLSTLDGSNGFRIDGIDAFDQSGRSVSSAGDVNGDGFDDILIGASGADPGGDGYAGESYVVFGKATGFGASLDLSTLDGSNGFRIDGIDAFDYSGRSVSSAGDVNGDGFDDILIGAFGGDPGGDSGAGASYVIFGKGPSSGGFGASLDLSTLDGSNGFRIDGIDAFDQSGRSVSSAGDVNGDGFDDILIGAYRGDPGGDGYAGESYVVFGKASGFGASLDLATLDGSNGFRIDGIDAGDQSGFSVSSARDVNGDGFDDILIGANGADPGGDSAAGESYVVFGKATGFGSSLDLSTLDGNNGFRIDGIDASDFSGRSVSSAGDVNGDGFDDILIGASSADPGGDYSAGESYVVYGRATGTLTRVGTDQGEGLGGGDWDDTLTGLGGNDRMNGGGGDDLISGGADDDILDGGDGDDNISGGSGVDNLKGGLGVDVLNGGSGVDTLDGGDEGDTLAGGSGSDIYFTDGFDTLIEAAGSGTDTVNSTATLTLAANLENLTLLGSLAIDGTGNSGNNTITGNTGVNTLKGGSGIDTLAGGDSGDFLYGGLGNDILSGNAGADSFVFDTTLNGTTNVDTISTVSSIDKIIVDNDIFTALGTGFTVDEYRSIDTGTVFTSVDASDNIIYLKSTGELFYDRDGSGTTYSRVLFADLAANTTLAFAQFLMIE